MDLDQNGFDLSRPSMHNNVMRELSLPKCGLTSRGTFGIEARCTIVVNKGIHSVLSFHESWGPRCDLVEGLDLTLSSMIRLEFSGACEEVRQNIIGISEDENTIGYLP
ncbi:UNVERIFIED_CONTAM: hypothetical protein Sradi_5087800 [Sesamum radiatum]|uniref:Uncharacterized protein n=1 Tax=Sesamum radiatum TaxID=300843 RepID=A0AAW2M139_SESRA